MAHPGTRRTPKTITAYTHNPHPGRGPVFIDKEKDPALAPPGNKFFVSVRDGKRAAYLLGPYDDHATALGHVDRARGLASARDCRSAFYGFGTCSMPADMAAEVKAVFGK